MICSLAGGHIVPTFYEIVSKNLKEHGDQIVQDLDYVLAFNITELANATAPEQSLTMIIDCRNSYGVDKGVIFL